MTAPSGSLADDADAPDVARLRAENTVLSDELSAARADVEILQTRLTEIGSLRRHAIRALIDALHTGDARIQRRLTPRHPFRPAEAPPTVTTDASGLLASAGAADRASVRSYRQPSPRARLLERYRVTSRRLYGAAVDRYRRRRRSPG